MKSRNASAVLFGFDFQINAAIVLMLDNIKDLKSLKLEGNYEDIELTFNNGDIILAQAKAVVNSSYDFRNVRQNLNKALKSLSEGCRKTGSQKAIFITNSPNPFNDDESKSVFCGLSRRKFCDIPPSAQNIIRDYLKDINDPINPEFLTVRVLPFETDDETERYKVVKQCVLDFLGSLNINDNILGYKLLSIWQKEIFKNGTLRNTAQKLNKKDIVWPIIVIMTDVQNIDFLDQFDKGLYEEIVQKYRDTINTSCERMESVTKILYDFYNFNSSKPLKEKYNDFIENSWESYMPEFDVDEIAPEIKELLIKTILHGVLSRRIKIDQIRAGTGI